MSKAELEKRIEKLEKGLKQGDDNTIRLAKKLLEYIQEANKNNDSLRNYMREMEKLINYVGDRMIENAKRIKNIEDIVRRVNNE